MAMPEKLVVGSDQMPDRVGVDKKQKNKSADEKLSDFLSSVDTDKFEILWDEGEYAGVIPRRP